MDKLYQAAHGSSSSDGVPPQKQEKSLYDELKEDGADPDLLESVKRATGKKEKWRVKEGPLTKQMAKQEDAEEDP